MAIRFTVSAVIPASPAELFDAWVSSRSHSAMTGGKAKISLTVGAPYSAWDGYISGRTLELVRGKLIRQTWRTTEFGARDADSEVAITLEPVPEGTRLTLVHSGIPAGHTAYKAGWQEHYFEPMIAYFAKRRVKA